jgi:hypothetical protein
MQNNILKALLLLVILGTMGIRLPSNYAQGTSEAERLLQKAVLLEDVDGNLQAAIQQYTKIIAENGKNRRVAAKALLRLAGCYEKLGQDQAKKTYEKLITDYPEQQQEVAAARQRLAAMTPPLNQKNEGMTVQMLWSGSGQPDTSGEISPDGRYMSCMGNTGDLAIRDLKTGKIRVLTKGGDWEKSATYAFSSRWSPDGTSLLLCGRRWGGKPACWIVEPNSGNVLGEVAGPQGRQAPTRGAVWAPDGKAVYYSTWISGEGQGRIVRHNLASGDEKILYSLNRFHNPIVLTVSPDGKFLAFTLEGLVENNKALARRIMVIPTAGGSARELMKSEQPVFSGSLAWSPDSRYLYFAHRSRDFGSRSQNSARVYRISVSEGAVEELQFEARGLTELRLSPDNRQVAFTQFGKSQGEIWVMENFLPIK